MADFVGLSCSIEGQAWEVVCQIQFQSVSYINHDNVPWLWHCFCDNEYFGTFEEWAQIPKWHSKLIHSTMLQKPRNRFACLCIRGRHSAERLGGRRSLGVNCARLGRHLLLDSDLLASSTVCTIKAMHRASKKESFK